MNADVGIYVHDVLAHETYGHERSMSSDVEISVVWMVPRNSGDN